MIPERSDAASGGDAISPEPINLDTPRPDVVRGCGCGCFSSAVVLKILIYEGIRLGVNRLWRLDVFALLVVWFILAVSAWFVLSSMSLRPRGKNASAGTRGKPHPLGDDQVRVPSP